MGKLLYKDMILLKSTKVYIYLIVFTILCCILSIKLPTIGITYIIFTVFLVYNSMVSIENKYDGKNTLLSMMESEKNMIVEKNVFNTFMVIAVGVVAKVLGIVGFLQLSNIQIILALILTQVLVIIYSPMGYKKDSQIMFILTLFLSIMGSTIITIINFKLKNRINVSLLLLGYILFVILGIFVSWGMERKGRR